MSTFVCDFLICQYILVVFDILKSFAGENWVFSGPTADLIKLTCKKKSHPTNDFYLLGTVLKDNMIQRRFICSLHKTNQIRTIRLQKRDQNSDYSV